MTQPPVGALSEEIVDQLYAAQVRPVLFGRARPVDRPVAAFVGAQPGAGKSSIMTRLRGRFNGNVAAISGDDFRQFHPLYAQLRESDPVAMPNGTQQFSGPAVARAIAEARRRRVNVIVEGTYRDPATTFATMQAFADAGYRTELVTVSTSVYTSQVAAQQRYLNAVDQGYDARWTPRSALRRGYEESAAILTAGMAVAACHAITVVDRDGVELTRIARDAGGRWPQDADPEAVCRAYREQSRPSVEAYGAQVDELVTLAVAVGAMDGPEADEVAATHRQLRADIEELRALRDAPGR